MDVKAYLLQQGLSEEETNTLAGNEKYRTVLEASAKQFEEAKAARAAADQALADAQKNKTDLENFWKNEATPKLLQADQTIAQTRAEKARLAAYLQSLAEQGYDIPKEYLDTPATPPNPAGTPSNGGPANGQYFTREDAKKEFESTAENLTLIQDLNNEYFQLFGSFPTSLNADLKEARTQNKGLRDFVRAKYNFDGKRSEIEAKKAADREAAIRKEERDKVLAEEAAKRHDPETRVQLPSNYDALRSGPNKDTWKTEAGRKQAKEARLRQFANIRLQ